MIHDKFSQKVRSSFEFSRRTTRDQIDEGFNTSVVSKIFFLDEATDNRNESFKDVFFSVEDFVQSQTNEVAWFRARVGEAAVCAPPKLLCVDGIAHVGRAHVHRNKGHRDGEEEVELLDGLGEKGGECGEGGVLECAELDIHCAKFRAPSDFVLAGWRGLEAHGLPIRGLDVFEVDAGLAVVDVDHLIEDDKRVADEEVSEVSRKSCVNSGVFNLLENLSVCFDAFVVVVFEVDGAVGDVHRDVVVARLDDAWNFGAHAAVDRRGDGEPTNVGVAENTLLERRGAGESEEERRDGDELIVHVASLAHVLPLHGDLKAVQTHSEAHRVHVDARSFTNGSWARARIEALFDVGFLVAVEIDILGEEVVS